MAQGIVAQAGYLVVFIDIPNLAPDQCDIRILFKKLDLPSEPLGMIHVVSVETKNILFVAQQVDQNIESASQPDIRLISVDFVKCRRILRDNFFDLRR